jgi:hypothetical protein
LEVTFIIPLDHSDILIGFLRWGCDAKSIPLGYLGKSTNTIKFWKKWDLQRRFSYVGGDFEYFNLFCLPLATGVLVRRNPNFLPRTKAFRAAFVSLAGGYVVAEENFRVAHFHAAQHIVFALYENPARGSRSIFRRVNHFADESSIRRKSRWNRKQYRERQTQEPAFHVYFDAKPLNGVGLSVVILKPQMSNE